MTLDLFPLNAVVFPHQKLPLRIFEPRYLKLIDDCHKEAAAFGVCLIREGKEVGAPAVPVKIGTSVVIKEFTRVSDNLFYIIVQGERRFKIERVIQEQPHIQVEVEWIDNKLPGFPGDYPVLRNIATKLLNNKYKIPDNDDELLGLLGALISVIPQEKQKILEMSRTEVIPALIRFIESL